GEVRLRDDPARACGSVPVVGSGNGDGVSNSR
ncbi:hypothetical protein A2U01_0118984, partial [Trifolium medium]|nr:hypothetical protein [Trifolium medium]